MTPEQIHRVQETFEKIAPCGETFAEQFYITLFRLALDVRPLFKSDAREQQRKFLTTLIFVVRNLQYPERILPSVQDLGRRHAQYGVTPEHYTVVANALLATLATALGNSFDAATREAWAAAYGLLASVMQDAAAHPAPHQD